MNDFASRLKMVRKELGFTQEQMGNKCGIKKSGYSMIENGNAKLTQRNLERLIEALNINPVWLESGRGYMFNCASKSQPKSDHQIAKYKLVPMFEMNAITATGEMNPDDIIRFLPFCSAEEGDISVTMTDRSMTPILTVNSILLLSIEKNFIPELDNGKPFVVLLKDGRRFVRNIFVEEDADTYICCSTNKEYDDTEIPKNHVTLMFRVKSVYYETIY